MYCRKCYAKLDPSEEFHRCPRCDRGFDPSDKSTYLPRPFPGKWRIVWYVITTTIISFVVAYIVACFQLAGASGH
jgi:hypothetical protein